jgi:hypothetical protein
VRTYPRAVLLGGCPQPTIRSSRFRNVTGSRWPRRSESFARTCLLQDAKAFAKARCVVHVSLRFSRVYRETSIHAPPRPRPAILCSSTAAAVETMNSLMVPIAPLMASRASNMWLARNSKYWPKRSSNRIAKPRRPYLHCNTRDRNDRGPLRVLLGYAGHKPLFELGIKPLQPVWRNLHRLFLPIVGRSVLVLTDCTA